MNLDRVAVAVRPRRPWEAVDLGFHLAREWWRPLATVWCAVLGPLWLVLLVPAYWSPLLATLLVWWFKPFYDVPVLYVVSRRLFGAEPGWRETRRYALRAWRRHWWRLLFWRRIQVSRSFFLPILLLEGLSGRPLAARRRLLGRRDVLQTVLLLTISCIVVETFLELACLGGLALLIPSGLLDIWGELARYFEPEEARWFEYLSLAAWLVALPIVESCYVAAGFCLYLNRRTELEGWDVEVEFRRIGRRLGRPTGLRAGVVGLVGLLVLGVSLWPVAPLRAGALPDPPDPSQVIVEVLDSAEFETTRTVRSWRGLEPNEGATSLLPSELIAGIGGLIEVVLWIGAFVLLAWFLWQLVPVLDRHRRAPSAGIDDSEALIRRRTTGDGGGDPLPLDVPAAARAELDRGHPLLAASLLYRGALALLMRRHHRQIPRSWTEEQVVDSLLERLPDRHLAYVRDVTGTWQSLAYGHRLPDPDWLRGLCDRWAEDLA